MYMMQVCDFICCHISSNAKHPKIKNSIYYFSHKGQKAIRIDQAYRSKKSKLLVYPTINSLLITVQLWQSNSCFWIHLVKHSYILTKTGIPYKRINSNTLSFKTLLLFIPNRCWKNTNGKFLHTKKNVPPLFAFSAIYQNSVQPFFA